MNFLKEIDIFGAKFNFTILGKTHYNTKFGGILTLITVALSLIFTLLFGSDMFFRKNPKVIIERIVPDNYDFKYYNVSSFPFYWTLLDSYNNLVNFTDFLYPISILYVYNYNSSKNLLELNDTVILPNKKCTKKMVNNNDNFENLGLNNYYCIDWTDSPYPLGGYWDSTDSVYSFQQTFLFCPYDNRTSEKCTDFSALKNFLGQSNKIYYSIYYPEVYFSPTNYNQPLQTTLINKYYEISANIYKKNRYFFNEAEINSNRGWIFDSFTNTKLITIDNNNNDIDFLSDDDLKNKNMTSGIYSTAIYLMKNHNSYNISYMKVQDLAAQVGGLIKIIMVFFMIINFFFNQFSRDQDVMNKIFEIKKLEDGKAKVDDMNRVGLKEFISKRKTLFELKTDRDEIIRTPSIGNIVDTEMNHIQYAIKNITKKIDHEQSNEFVIDTIGYIKYTFNLCLNPNEKEFFDIFEIGRNLLTRKLDITKYLKMINQINHLMNLLLKPYQIFLLDNQKKINLFCPKERLHFDIHENEDLSSENEMQINLIHTIVKKIKENSLETLDNNLYKHLDLYYKKFIDDLISRD